jgi:hypothetical protein
MKRLIVVLALCVAGCGGSSNAGPDASTPVTLQSLFPADNAVTGWAVDTTQSPSGVETYTTEVAVEATSVDGDITPFQDVGFVGLGRVFYKNATLIMELRVWQMKDAASGATAYTQVLTDPPATHYKDITFTDTAIGSAGRTGFFNPQWYVDSYKGAYFVEARLKPSTSTATADRDQAVAMVTAAIAKIP